MAELVHELQKEFEKGLFVGKLRHGKSNGVWYDYVLEATENKELKGSGGIIGLTIEGTALTRWFLSRLVTSQYSSMYHDALNGDPAQKNQEYFHNSARSCEQKT